MSSTIFFSFLFVSSAYTCLKLLSFTCFNHRNLSFLPQYLAIGGLYKIQESLSDVALEHNEISRWDINLISTTHMIWVCIPQRNPISWIRNLSGFYSKGSIPLDMTLKISLNTLKTINKQGNQILVAILTKRNETTQLNSKYTLTTLTRKTQTNWIIRKHTNLT